MQLHKLGKILELLYYSGKSTLEIEIYIMELCDFC